MKRLAVLLALAPSAARAHSGDHSLANIAHLLSEPDHLAMIAAGIAVVAYAAAKLRARR